jgi:predicted 3-demethylubiquinone-9 3-methyltransferase (glyoxalase superfamily)
MPKFMTCLWFDNQAEQAAKFYVSVFKAKSKVGKISRYGDAASKASGRPKGSVLTVSFTLNGQPFFALNGGPIFKFTEAVSLVVPCKTQKEIDYYWNKLAADPSAGQCGWLKDKYGLSWQIVPSDWEKMTTGDPKKVERYMAAMMQMKKLDIVALRKAYAGK